MTAKQFLFFKLIVVVILAGVVSSFITVGNYVIPLLVLMTAGVLLYFIKKRVKDVMEDERDFEIAGKAARYAMTIFSLVGGVVIIVIFALRHTNPDLELVGSVFAYAVCFLLLCYSLLFKYFQQSPGSRRRYVLSVVIVVVLFCLLVFGLRLFSGEDNWICQGGQWLQHGQPDFPAPAESCR
ncbi:MAG: DUF2178 domain-containing protein [Patescibacteria group bacterium]|jgi:uncharacterized membrane protein